MKTAYKIDHDSFDNPIIKVQVEDDWTQEKHQEEVDYLVWESFEAARSELIKGLQAEVEDLNNHIYELKYITEEELFQFDEEN